MVIKKMADEEAAYIKVIVNAVDDSVIKEQQCPPTADISTLKGQFAPGVDNADVQLSYNGENLSDETRLSDISSAGVQVQLTLHLPAKLDQVPKASSVAGDNRVDKSVSFQKQDGQAPAGEKGRLQHSKSDSYCMPATLSVSVDDNKKVLVFVQKCKFSKPFLGGYRHKGTAVEYHNAGTQTAKPSLQTILSKDIVQRETQTYFTKNILQQTISDAATQMSKTGCFVSSKTDKVLYAGKYETAEEYHKKRYDAVLVIQRYVRRWLAVKYVEGLRRERKERLIWETEQSERRKTEREERIKREFARRLNPKTKEDFEVLYHALEMWRVEELQKIRDTTSGPEQKAALCELLEQEAELIASIGKHKVLADKENKQRVTHTLLDNMSAPRKWISFDGGTTEMSTPYTVRAQQLKELYQTLSTENLTSDERLDALLSLKVTVSEHNCKLTQEIVQLIDREADLLQRGMVGDTLSGLRKRILTLFLQYIKTPLFNPAASAHIKVPADPSLLKAKVHYCRSCSSYLPSTEFELTSNSRVVGHCRRCKELDNAARSREDHTLYRALLKEIKISEESFNDGSRIIYLFQESDIQHLIESVWASQSVLSAAMELPELVLVRWDRREQWSPWNCVLLTRDEAIAHEQLDSLERGYGKALVQKVTSRHVLAKSYFTKLPHFKDQMESKVIIPPLVKGQHRVVSLN